MKKQKVFNLANAQAEEKGRRNKTSIRHSLAVQLHSYALADKIMDKSTTNPCLEPHCGRSVQDSRLPYPSIESEIGIDLVSVIGARFDSSIENDCAMAKLSCCAFHGSENETWTDVHGCGYGSDSGHVDCIGSNPERNDHARHTRSNGPLGGKDVPGEEGRASGASICQLTSRPSHDDHRLTFHRDLARSLQRLSRLRIR